MNPAEVVIHEIERERVLVILKLFREPIRQPSESADGHTHREILALGEAADTWL
jgi:hypothetical protein